MLCGWHECDKGSVYPMVMNYESIYSIYIYIVKGVVSACCPTTAM